MISLVIGLGNIGVKYAGTRHNMGFEVLNIAAGKIGIAPSAGDGDYFVGEKEYGGRMVRFIWPTTFMNNSGAAVKQAVEKYDVPLDEILVVYDDCYLPLGTIRIRRQGSDGGHNGMESVIYHLESEEIIRLRVGIGPLPEEIDLIEFVLGRFSEKEAEIKEKVLGKSAEAVLYLLSHSPEEAMSQYNRNPAPEEE